jgi:hypothetical protein
LDRKGLGETGLPASDSGGPTTSPGSTSSSAASTGVIELQMPPSVRRDAGGYRMETGWEILDIARAFYAENPDDVDFLVIYTDQVVQGLFAFTLPLAHDVSGIGQEEVMALYGWEDLDPTDAGSAGRLQAVLMMNHASVYAPGARWGPQDILVHEATHRWGANLRLAATGDPWSLVDASYAHWAHVASVGGPSALGYGELLEEAPGSFRFELASPLVNSDLELYQMGLLSAEEVGPLFLVTDASAHAPAAPWDGRWDPDDYGQAVAFQGTRVDFTLEDVVALHGPRVPDSADAQRAFRSAFVLACEGSCPAEDLAFADAQRLAWPATFARATRGLASME